MARYLWEILWEAVTTSIEAIGQPLQVLLYSVLIFILGGMLIWRRHGWIAMKENIGKTIGEVLLVGVIAWLPFLFFYVCRVSYLRWKSTDDTVKALRAKYETSPEFAVQINSAWWGTRNNKPRLFIDGVLTHPTGPPSGIYNWQMKIKLKSSREVVGTPPLMSAQDEKVQVGKAGFLLLQSSHYWPSQTMNPIPTGAAISGWFQTVFEGITENDFLGADVIISFEDVLTGKKHEFKTSIGSERSLTIPGG